MHEVSVAVVSAALGVALGQRKGGNAAGYGRLVTATLARLACVSHSQSCPAVYPPSLPPLVDRWWSFEALILMSGWLPDATLAVATMGVANLTNSVS